MSQELSEKVTEATVVDKKRTNRWSMLILLPLWIFISYIIAQAISYLLIVVLKAFQVDFGNINQSVFVLLLSAFIYVIMILFSLGLPWLIKKQATTLDDIGLKRLPSWMDILLSPAGLVIYMIISAVLVVAITTIFPSIDMNQAQETGFDNLSQRYEYYLAFAALVIMAPIAEEVLFRGYLYGKLKKYVPIWAAILMTSITFGAIHGAWNLAIDTFALSVIMCLLREITGNIWASILLHMMKNGIAYYFLFINTTLLTTLGG